MAILRIPSVDERCNIQNQLLDTDQRWFSMLVAIKLASSGITSRLKNIIGDIEDTLSWLFWMRQEL